MNENFLRPMSLLASAERLLSVNSGAEAMANQRDTAGTLFWPIAYTNRSVCGS